MISPKLMLEDPLQPHVIGRKIYSGSSQCWYILISSPCYLGPAGGDGLCCSVTFE